MNRTGQCMCGAVTYAAEMGDSFGACHCTMCQQWSAGMYMAVRTTEFEIRTGTEHLKVFKSSDWAERGFCGTCGSNLYYQLKDMSPSVALGSLDDKTGLSFERQLFVDHKQADFSFENQTENMTSDELKARFSAS